MPNGEQPQLHEQLSADATREVAAAIEGPAVVAASFTIAPEDTSVHFGPKGTSARRSYPGGPVLTSYY